MPNNFRATDQPVYWAVVENGTVIASDVTEIGGLTITGEDKTFPHDSNENTFLGDVAGMGGDYNPLPAVGEWVEALRIYSHADDLVICRQSHFMRNDSLSNIALFIVYRPDAEMLDWVVGEQVEIGMHRMYQGVEYVCLQAHVTQSDWTPPSVPALWQKYIVSSPEWQAGIAYAIDDEVTYQEVLYRCIQAHTSQIGWEPPNVPALWTLV